MKTGRGACGCACGCGGTIHKGLADLGYDLTRIATYNANLVASLLMPQACRTPASGAPAGAQDQCACGLEIFRAEEVITVESGGTARVTVQNTTGAVMSVGMSVTPARKRNTLSSSPDAGEQVDIELQGSSVGGASPSFADLSLPFVLQAGESKILNLKLTLHSATAKASKSAGSKSLFRTLVTFETDSGTSENLSGDFENLRGRRSLPIDVAA